MKHDYRTTLLSSRELIKKKGIRHSSRWFAETERTRAFYSRKRHCLPVYISSLIARKREKKRERTREVHTALPPLSGCCPETSLSGRLALRSSLRKSHLSLLWSPDALGKSIPSLPRPFKGLTGGNCLLGRGETEKERDDEARSQDKERPRDSSVWRESGSTAPLPFSENALLLMPFPTKDHSAFRFRRRRLCLTDEDWGKSSRRSVQGNRQWKTSKIPIAPSSGPGWVWIQSTFHDCMRD